MIESIKNSIKKHPQSQTSCYEQRERRVAKSYLQTAVGSILQGGLLFLRVGFLFILLVSFCKGFIRFYSATPVGQKLIQSNPLILLYLQDLQNIKPIIAGWELLSVTMIIGIGCGICFQFFQLTDMFYNSRGLLGKIVCFAPPLASIVSFLTTEHLGLHWQIVFTASLIPALGFFQYCFTIPGQLVPELGDLLQPWLHLSLAWYILRQELLRFILAAGMSLAGYVAFEKLFEKYGFGISYLPSFTYEIFYFTNTLSFVQLGIFVLRLCTALFFTGILSGVLGQLLGLSKLLTKQQIIINGLSLTIVFSSISNNSISVGSPLATFVFSSMPAFFVAPGCFHMGHYLVVNISFLRKLQDKIHVFYRMIGETF